MAKSNEDLIREINDLRNEMKQMREVLNVLFQWSWRPTKEMRTMLSSRPSSRTSPVSIIEHGAFFMKVGER